MVVRARGPCRGRSKATIPTRYDRRLEPAIKTGDIVAARAGGPPMNVRSIAEQRVMCSWFDFDGKRHVDVFDIDALVLLHDLSDLDDRGHRRPGG
jgi:uncharacterized protein YodC (DUF2158 family)